MTENIFEQDSYSLTDISNYTPQFASTPLPLQPISSATQPVIVRSTDPPSWLIMESRTRNHGVENGQSKENATDPRLCLVFNLATAVANKYRLAESSAIKKNIMFNSAVMELFSLYNKKRHGFEQLNHSNPQTWKLISDIVQSNATERRKKVQRKAKRLQNGPLHDHVEIPQVDQIAHGRLISFSERDEVMVHDESHRLLFIGEVTNAVAQSETGDFRHGYVQIKKLVGLNQHDATDYHPTIYSKTQVTKLCMQMKDVVGKISAYENARILSLQRPPLNEAFSDSESEEHESQGSQEGIVKTNGQRNTVVDEDDALCNCGIFWSKDIDGPKWILCSACNTWHHGACGRIEGRIFLCTLCDD